MFYTYTDLSTATSEQLKEHQNAMEEKVYRIWTVLSAFEESAAGCISDMLLHVSEGSYEEGVKMAAYFVTHVEVLFNAIDDLASDYWDQIREDLQYDREATLMTEKVSKFFSLLSHTQENGLRKIGITQELLSLVTGLAHYLKVLIRIGLTGALKLDKSGILKSTSISQFLSQLMELANKKKPYLDESEYTVASDLCQGCRGECRTACFRYESSIWHDKCFTCSICSAPQAKNYKSTSIKHSTSEIVCSQCEHKAEGLVQGVQYVSKLRQLSFLLRFALRRLCSLLDVPDPMINSKAPPIHEIQPKLLNYPSQPYVPPIPPLPKLNNEESSNEQIHLNDIKRMKSTQMNRKVTNSHRIGKRSTLMEVPMPNAAFISNPSDHRPQSQVSNKRASFNELNGFSEPSRHKYTKSVPEAKSFYFAELGTLQHFMLKHIAVLYLEEILHSHFTIEELAGLIDDKKNTTFWGKFGFMLKSNKKAAKPKEEGTFGVPIELLVEKNGIESNLGVGPTRIIKIPAFVDECISSMKQMDMSTEGIFRKSGNNKKLKELQEEIDKNPNGVQLSQESIVNIAILLKTFLRELPDPLLTFKLHKLFMVAEKLESEAERKRVLHLACCLLPKVNRDTMEVLFVFMKWVSQFAHLENNTGNKMDLSNLATVIAPNILHPKTKEPAKENTHGAIRITATLIENAEEFATVPEDFIPLLQNLSYEEADMDMSVRHILKKCETVMKLKRSQAAGGPLPPQLPRQHSSPAQFSINNFEGDLPLPPDTLSTSPQNMCHLESRC
ncbi:hypothetical protein BY458DRAFT_536525 [Sporodiniella umbellata]|nr:hypothetical protein BY458DRAFT_536525 [Sporodiniella umbellata]